MATRSERTGWQHTPTYTYAKGRVMVSCRCGGRSGWGTEDEAKAWYRQHTGLKEKGQRRDKSL